VVPEVRPVLAAVIVEEPLANPNAMPELAIMEAVAAVPELQVTAAVGVISEPSLIRNCAVKSSTPPTRMVGFAWTIFTATGTGTPPVPTVRVTGGETMAPRVAVIWHVPFAAPAVARPVAEIVAIAPGVQLHVTWEERSALLASLYVPVAVN